MVRLRRSRLWPRAVGIRTSNPAQSQIDPSAFGQQGRCAWFDAIDAMKCQPAIAAKNQGVAGTQAERSGRVVAFRSADAKHTGIAERERQYRRVEYGLVAILMQSHFRGWTVEIDQARLRWGSVMGKLGPGLQQGIRHRWPRSSGHRVCRLITIALFIGHPTERSAV